MEDIKHKVRHAGLEWWGDGEQQVRHWEGVRLGMLSTVLALDQVA